MSIGLFIRYIYIIFKVRMEYRVDFFLGIFGQLFGYGSSFLIVWILLQKFEVIDGWLWPEIAFLISLGILTYAIGATFFYTPMTSLDQLIIQGEFDKFLIKPITPLINLVASMFNFGYIAHIIIGLSFLSWSISSLSINWSLLKVIYLIFCIISGSLLQGAILIIIGASSFKFLRIEYLFNLVSKIRDFSNYPLSIYNIFIQTGLTVIIPIAFVNYYPSMFILDKNWSILTVIAPIIGPLFFALSLIIWSKGMKQYQGTGS